MNYRILLWLIIFAELAFSQETRIGIVLTGGGSFGAFEAGALKGFFDRWAAVHCPDAKVPCSPPVSIVAGNSTGALIAPFVALGSPGVSEVNEIYRNVEQKDIVNLKLGPLLPFALFAKWSQSIFGVAPLQKLLRERLTDTRLDYLENNWPQTRLVVLGTDFKTGMPVEFTNNSLGADFANFRDAILASAMSPLAMPPIYIKDGSSKARPILDGGIHSVAPFRAFFDTAAIATEISCTHLIVFSAFPRFPAPDATGGMMIQKQYPDNPKFGDIGARMDAIISESSISKELALVWAAIELRNRGVSSDIVFRQTGLKISQPPQSLIFFGPAERLGWDNLRFDKNEMRRMADLGYHAAPQILTGDMPR